MESIKRSEADFLSRKLIDCKKQLQLGRIYPCLLDFKELLEGMRKTNMLASDEKELSQEINTFQRRLADSKSFKDIFGPVTFQDADHETTLAFICQLIAVEEEEILSSASSSQNNGAGQKTDTENFEGLVNKVVMLIDRELHDRAREIYDDDEKLRSAILHQYNQSGIFLRKEGRYAEAVAEFKKALTVEPADEGLYYNMSRTYVEKGDLDRAETAIREALKINGDFREGRDLLLHIQRQKHDQAVKAPTVPSAGR